MVFGIRAIEEAMGNGVKIPAFAETHNINIARRSLVAAIDIKKGDVFTEENLTNKRPGFGESSINYWDCLGTKAKKSFLQDDIVTL